MKFGIKMQKLAPNKNIVNQFSVQEIFAKFVKVFLEF